METLAYVVVSVGISVAAVIVAIRLASLHPLPPVKVGALDVTAAAFWLLMSGLDLTTSNLSVKLFLFQMRFFGVLLIPPCWLALAMLISGHERWVNRRNIIALSAVPIISLLLVFTNWYHGLMWTNVELNPVDPKLPLNLTFGLVFGLLVVGYSYVVISVGSVIFLRRLLLSRRSFRVQAYPLLIASSIPWAANMLYLYNQNLFGFIEPTSLTLTVAGVIVLWRVIQWPGLYIAPVAHEVLVDSMNDPVIVLDYERRVVDVNPRAQALIGRSYSEIAGLPAEKVWPEWSNIVKILNEKAEGGREVSFGTGDKTQYYKLESSRLPGFTSDEINLLIILRNITERKLIDEKLRLYSEHLEELVEERTKKLRETERMAAIGEMAAMVGHDLRNPLQGVLGATYLLKDELGSMLGDKTKEIIEIIEDSVQRSNKIVNDLLDYSREPKLKLDDTDLNQLVKETVAAAGVPENIGVRLALANERLTVDIDKIRRVFLNIIGNAVDAMPKGGELVVESKVSDDGLQISFTDTGMGISSEVLAELWKPFHTTKAKGMGLGLAICKKIVEAHDGSISVKSSLGNGTTFTITLPIGTRLESTLRADASTQRL